nr:hypothetical protein [Micrococcus luteus]
MSKYVNAWFWEVWVTDHSRDTTNTEANAVVRTARGRAPVRRATRAETRKRSGHRMNTCPWTDSDQKCWKGDSEVLSAA